MSKSVVLCAKTGLLTAVVLLVVADSAQAQVFGGGGRGGRGGQWGGGVGSPAYGGYGGSPYGYGGYSGYPYGTPYYSGYAPYGTYSSYPYNYSSPYMYATPYSTGTTPYYQSATGTSPTSTSYQSFYPPTGAIDAQTGSASIEVIVPAQAAVAFDGSKTQQTGPRRWFTTPPINGTYTYEVCATWTDQSGKEVRRTRTVHVAPNQHSFVNFMDSQSMDTGSVRDNKDGK